jgi:hypothetical protein
MGEDLSMQMFSFRKIMATNPLLLTLPACGKTQKQAEPHLRHAIVGTSGSVLHGGSDGHLPSAHP